MVSTSQREPVLSTYVVMAPILRRLQKPEMNTLGWRHGCEATVDHGGAMASASAARARVICTGLLLRLEVCIFSIAFDKIAVRNY